MKRQEIRRERPATHGAPSKSIINNSRIVRREVTVTLDRGKGWAEVSPYSARGLCLSVGARPVWLAARRVWSVNYGHGIDVVALAEHLGWTVVVLSDGGAA